MPAKKRAISKSFKVQVPVAPPPDWPPLTPLVPPSDLALSTLEESQIILIRNFWTSKLCKDYVAFLKGLPLTTTPGQPKKGDALRVNDRYQVFDEGFANRLWLETGLKDIICGNEAELEENGVEVEGVNQQVISEKWKDLWGGDPVGLNPSIRIYRYTKGQFFDGHYDESNTLTINTKPTPTPVRTTWTLLLYLTSPTTGCQGGETVFYPDNVDGRGKTTRQEIVVGLETGMVLLHKHGNDCLLHEGREVIGGEKWVIRTDLCVRREKSKFAG